MSAQNPRVAVLVLNWNGRRDTVACLDSLARLDYAPVDVILVDNGSTDGSAEFFRACYPWVSLVENQVNMGFCEGNNIGIRRALAAGADYVMLLNNDATLAPDALGRLVVEGERDVAIGILGPKTYAMDRDEVIFSTGLRWNQWLGYSELIGLGEAEQGQYDVSCDRFALSGHAFLVKRRVLETIGSLDAEYFAYYEELDFCARARAAGFRCRYVADAVAWHRGHGSSAGLLRNYLLHRNRLLFVRKNSGRRARWFFLAYFFAYRMPKTALAYALRGRFDHLAIFAQALLWHVGLCRRDNPIVRQLTPR